MKPINSYWVSLLFCFSLVVALSSSMTTHVVNADTCMLSGAMPMVLACIWVSRGSAIALANVVTAQSATVLYLSTAKAMNGKGINMMCRSVMNALIVAERILPPRSQCLDNKNYLDKKSS
jgi:hypothetical protein